MKFFKIAKCALCDALHAYVGNLYINVTFRVLALENPNAKFKENLEF